MYMRQFNSIGFTGAVFGQKVTPNHKD